MTEFGRTLKSAPDFFRLAQSSGPWPGASATFLDTFLEGAFVVLKGTANEDAVGGMRIKFEDGAAATPGRLAARAGEGGGGIRLLSLRIRGTGSDPGACGAASKRCALFKLGKAGGASSSSASPLIVSLSSSESSLGGDVRMLGVAGILDVDVAVYESQLKRYEDMYGLNKVLKAPEDEEDRKRERFK